jgi:hypothetical protein
LAPSLAFGDDRRWHADESPALADRQRRTSVRKCPPDTPVSGQDNQAACSASGK